MQDIPKCAFEQTLNLSVGARKVLLKTFSTIQVYAKLRNYLDNDKLQDKDYLII